jgi:aryl-alcohol dehydrogenase-like predicted oxidoreductase
MKYRAFGPLSVSEVVFGAMRYMRAPKGAQPDARAAEAALNEALDRGVNVVHSSYEYGSQEATGKFLAGRKDRDRLLHMVKTHKDAVGWTGEQFGRWIEEQLRLLHTERIAILQVRGMTWEDERRIFDVAAPFIAQGKVTTAAIFAYDADNARAALDDGRCTGLAAYINPMYLFAGDAFPMLASAGKKIFAFQPLAEGALSDSRTTWDALPAGDRLKNDRGRLFLEHRAKVAALLGGAPQSWLRFGLGLTLGRQETAGIVVSMNTPDQVRGLLDALDSPPVDDATFFKLVDLFKKGMEGKVGKFG